jgi:hypothetical protein
VIGAVHVALTEFNVAMADIDRRSDRANMWALREAGRQTKRAARKVVRVKSGALKASLGSGKLTTVSARNYRLTVQPRGPKTFLYAGKIEELDHYMQAGYGVVAPKFPAICQKAIDRVVARYGPL